MAYDRSREVAEAIAAGRRAIEALRSARGSLDSAGSWGWFDVFAGGFVTSVIKHSRLRDAREALAVAATELAQGVVGVSALDSVIDIALDNAVMDLIVQSKISDAKDRVDDAIRRTQDAVDRLEALR